MANWLMDADKPHQKVASQQVLFAGHRQRYTSQATPMKNVATTVGGILGVVVVLGLAIDTGSAKPPDDALVYLNPSQSTYSPPTRTPANSGYIPVSYAEARRRGARPDDVQGFNIDGPPLLISILELAGVIREWPRYWLGTNTAVEKAR